VSHHWGNNTITIQGNNTIRTIFVTKKLGAPTKNPYMLLFTNEVINIVAGHEVYTFLNGFFKYH